MTNAEIIQAIKDEIERLYNDKAYSEDRWDLGYDCACEDILSFLSTLESEKPMNLEEEIKRYLHEECSDDDEPGIHEIAEHFAEWGYLRFAEKYDVIEYNRQRAEESVPKDLEEAARKFVGYDMDCDELRDYEMGIASFIAGHNLCREQILKDAVEKTVGQLERQWGGNIHFMHGFEVDEMDFPFLNSQECGYGDKVRVIILPKEEKK